jgi:hypothetical protein
VFLVSKLCSTFDSGLLVVRDAWNEGDGRLFDCLVGTKDIMMERWKKRRKREKMLSRSSRGVFPI